MNKFLLWSYIFFALPAAAGSLTISDLSIRLGKNSSVYFTINNISNNIDYLIGAELIGHPEVIVTINKTVIEKGVARIITINKLAIPANYSVKLEPIGIYLVIKNLERKNLNKQGYKVKFFFKEAGNIIYSLKNNNI